MTTMSPAALKSASLSSYTQLRTAVRQTLLDGQQKIEQAKVQTYWLAGKHIHTYLFQNKDRSDHYGNQVIERLAKDLEISGSLLQRVVKFYRSFTHISAVRPESSRVLSWTHYRELMTVEDEKTRQSLLERASKNDWSHYKLIEKIKQEARPSLFIKGKAEAGGSSEDANPARAASPLIPKLGELYTYRLIREENAVQEDSFLRVDLGFELRKRLAAEEARGLKEGQIIRSVRSENGEFSFVPLTGREPDPKRMLYTYKARVLRVVDGDTLFCLIDLGFKIEQRHYLRLRGVNTSELSTTGGKRARAFVEKLLARVPEIIITSTQDDKYGRYLADVFLPNQGSAFRDQGSAKNKTQKASADPRPLTSDPCYLNQLLLDRGLAERMG